VGENVPNGSFNNKKTYSYCGPGTKYERRDHEGYIGVNDLDKACKKHDKCYNDYKDSSQRNVGDYELAAHAKTIRNNPEKSSKERNDAWKVEKVLGAKAMLCLGVKKKTLKNH
jgi:hypothetical protein